MRQQQKCKCEKYTFNFGMQDSNSTLICPECQREYLVYSDQDERGFFEMVLEIQKDYIEL